MRGRRTIPRDRCGAHRGCAHRDDCCCGLQEGASRGGHGDDPQDCGLRGAHLGGIQGCGLGGAHGERGSKGYVRSGAHRDFDAFQNRALRAQSSEGLQEFRGLDALASAPTSMAPSLRGRDAVFGCCAVKNDLHVRCAHNNVCPWEFHAMSGRRHRDLDGPQERDLRAHSSDRRQEFHAMCARY